MHNNNYTLLDNVTHKDLRVIPQYSADFGDNVASVPVFATELANVIKHYPVLFYPTDKTARDFTMVALLGLEAGENLFLNETLPESYQALRQQSGWAADYVPATVARGPFAIGLHENGNQVMVHVDASHPKLSTEQGKPLFLPKGGNSDYLNRISSILAVIHNGVQVTSDMVSMWHAMGLLEPMTVDIELVDGSKHTLGGHFAVSEEKVAALSATDLHTLHQHNYLQGLYLAMTSLNNLQTLIDLKNIRKHEELQAYA